MSTASLCTKLPSKTVSPSGMVGHFKTHHPTSSVDNHLVLSMLWLAKQEASQLRHNEVRDITATILTEVCHGVTTEPHQQPLSGKPLSLRVFNPSAQSNHQGPLSSVYHKHEQQKRRQYYDQQLSARGWTCNFHTTSAVRNGWNGT